MVALARLLGVLETPRAEVGVVRVAEGVNFITVAVLAGFFVFVLEEVGIGLEEVRVQRVELRELVHVDVVEEAEHVRLQMAPPLRVLRRLL